MLRMFCVLALLASCLPAQVTPFGSVGIGQLVCDPLIPSVPKLNAKLSGEWCPGSGLGFTVEGLGLTHATPVPQTNELVYLVLDSGFSNLPGVVISQGLFYIPFLAPIISAGVSAVPLGVPPTTCGIQLGTPCNTPWRNGARFNLGQIPPATTGFFTVQGYVVESAPAPSRIYTTNALNFSIP